VIQYHSYRSLGDLRRELVRRLAHTGSTFSGVGASDKLGPVQFDIGDISETPAEAWLQVRQPGLYRPIKKPVTLRLDADVIAWFKEHAQDRGYQTEINRIQRRYMLDAQT
jgi:uncharacterized protein (DUF4415 family)